MFRGDLRHTGVYNAPGAPKFNAIQWKFHTSGRVIASPASVNGVVYVGGTDGDFYADRCRVRDVEVEGYETKSWEVSSPAVVSGVVYFLSYDGHFYALDAAIGQVKWKFSTGGGALRGDSSSLFTAGGGEHARSLGLLFVVSQRVAWHGVFGSSDGYVYALDADSGAFKWKFKQGTWFTLRPRLPMGHCTSGAGTPSCMRSMRRAETRSGASKRERYPVAHQPRRNSVVARGDGRGSFFRIARFVCVRGRCLDGKTNLEILDERLLGEQLNGCVRREGVFWNVDSGIHARRRCQDRESCIRSADRDSVCLPRWASQGTHFIWGTLGGS